MYKKIKRKKEVKFEHFLINTLNAKENEEKKMCVKEEAHTTKHDTVKREEMHKNLLLKKSNHITINKEIKKKENDKLLKFVIFFYIIQF